MAWWWIASAPASPLACPRTCTADDAFSDEEGGGGAGDDGAELAAAVDAAALPSDMDRLGELLAELPWEFTITRDAWHEWLGMDPNYRWGGCVWVMLVP